MNPLPLSDSAHNEYHSGDPNCQTCSDERGWYTDSGEPYGTVWDDCPDCCETCANCDAPTTGRYCSTVCADMDAHPASHDDMETMTTASVTTTNNT